MDVVDAPVEKFADALAEAMSAKGYGDHELARGVSVPKARVTAWRMGAGLPTRPEFGRILCHLPRLRGKLAAFAPKGTRAEEVPRAQASAVVLASAPPGTYGPGDYGPDSFGGSDLPEEVAPAPPPPPRAPTFGAGLRREREAEEMTTAELGSLVGVTDEAVRQWEVGICSPILAHYVALLDLLPRLRNDPEPDWRDIDKPGPRAAPPPAISPEEAPDAAEQLIVDLVEVHGPDSGWGLSVRPAEPGEAGGGRWVVLAQGRHAQYEGRGESVAACYRVIRSELAAYVAAAIRAEEAHLRRMEAIHARIQGGQP